MSDETTQNDESSEAPGMAQGGDVAGTALGALAADETAAIRAAALDDPHLAAELAAMDATAAELARLAPLLQINRGRSAGIRSRLVSRASAAGRDGRTSPVRAPSEMVKPPKAPDVAGTGPKSSQKREQPQGQRKPVPEVNRPVVSAASVPVTPAPVSGGTDLQGRTPERLTARTRELAYNPASSSAWRFLAAAAVLACVALGTQLYRVMGERNDLRSTAAAGDSAMSAQVASLEGTVATKDSLIASLTGPSMKVVDLVNYTSHDPLARMFWDQKTQQWTMYAYNLRQPKPGKTYQVWLIASNASAPISAGTFHPDARGAAIMRATYPMDRGMLQKVAVSEEPEGGVPSPTGPIIIAGVGR